ncbi:MAG: shikimate dehydrogenase [Alphaproteobacteria bacterium]|nr:shikimate dehydrogenase [Alphaproteobacteria bacterium]
MIKAFVAGWPIAHSRSPLIHSYWLKQHGIAGSYERVAVPPEDIPGFIEGLPASGFAGGNVTLPHKEMAFRLAIPGDDTARRLAAVNTLYLKNGAVYGINTDPEGFLANLRATVPGWSLRGERAVVLGAGGAAISIVAALAEAGAGEIAIANRTPEKVAGLASRIAANIRAIPWEARGESLGECALLVNTTSLGMAGQPVLEISLERLAATALVTDIVYVPLKTALLRQAEARGNRVAGGLGMLLHQARRGFELWFGVAPTVTDELHDLVARDIDRSHGA